MAAMTPDEQAEALARNRWMVLNMVRIGGLLLVFVALAIEYGRIDLPRPAAWLLAAVGLFEFFILPGIIAKRWRSGAE
jgi:hypothetical protein